MGVENGTMDTDLKLEQNMSLNTAEKAKIMRDTAATFNLSTNDTGSPEIQVALITNQIRRLTEHLKTNKQDIHSRHGLVKLVSKRRRLLDYLKNVDQSRYQLLLTELDLRR